MTRGAVRICAYPGCPAVVPHGHPYPIDAVYCTDHVDTCPDCQQAVLTDGHMVGCPQMMDAPQ